MEPTWPARARPFGEADAEERRDTRLSLEVGGALDEAVKHRQRAAVAKWAVDNTGLGNDPAVRERLEYIAAQESLRAMHAMERAAASVEL